MSNLELLFKMGRYHLCLFFSYDYSFTWGWFNIQYKSLAIRPRNCYVYQCQRRPSQNGYFPMLSSMIRSINQEFSGWDQLPVSVFSSCGLDPCQCFKNANVSCTIKSSLNVSMRILAVTVNATEVLSGNAKLTTHTLNRSSGSIYK